MVWIYEWEKYKVVACNAFYKLCLATDEIVKYILHKTPLSKCSHGKLGGFRLVNRMMSHYISKFPDYLKQIDSGITVSPLDPDTLEMLRIIARVERGI